MRDHNPQLLSSSSLRNDEVRNLEGESLGDVQDFMIDLSNGQIVYAVLGFGGFLGLGEKYFAVPWEALEVDTENKCFVLDVDEEALEDAPGFDKNDWPRQPDRDFINRVHTHYGQDPYYDDSGNVRSRNTAGVR